MALISPCEVELKTILTDIDGLYEARRLPGGKKYVVVMAQGYNMATKEFELECGEVRTGIDFELIKAGSISGYVVDDNGDPVKGARVEIVYKEPLPPSPLKFDFWHTGTIQTLDKGFFYVGNIQSRTHFVLKVSHNEHKTFVSPLFSLNPGEEVKGLRVVLEAK
ncbi:MAG: carboxypeptidase regulatory-like domain-containing protein [Acidobacteria bacterium]|nr:carboxypeptidase regulatory-like domain-containing protein [Acidobacteriota bacterium]